MNWSNPIVTKKLCLSSFFQKYEVILEVIASVRKCDRNNVTRNTMTSAGTAKMIAAVGVNARVYTVTCIASHFQLVLLFNAMSSVCSMKSAMKWLNSIKTTAIVGIISRKLK
jgi:hypothetical protein